MNCDTEWVRKAADGDASAFEQLVRKYQTPVYNLALRMVGNRDDASDLAQEAFLRAWRGLGALRADTAFSSWLYRLTCNLCMDFLRGAKRRKTLSLTRPDEEADAQWDIPDPAPGPEDHVLLDEDRAVLERAMAWLNTEHRKILTLRVINGLSYAQIADILGVAEGTVKSRLARARRNLREKMIELGNQPALATSRKSGRRGHNEL